MIELVDESIPRGVPTGRKKASGSDPIVTLTLTLNATAETPATLISTPDETDPDRLSLMVNHGWVCPVIEAGICFPF